jgi:hypothetical protein
VIYKCEQRKQKAWRFPNLLGAALALGCAFAAPTQAQAQDIPAPATPAIITPPPGNSAFLLGHAEGTQGYVCLPTSAGASTASWTVNSSRPEAALFSDLEHQLQVITHFLSPNTNPNESAPNPLPFGSVTWQSSSDGSKLWAQVLHANTIPAGSDPSCPNAGSIPCLLLESIGSQEGLTGGKFMTRVTFVQRLNTKGGAAPAEGCAVAADVGKQALVPYTADYFFFRKDKAADSPR